MSALERCRLQARFALLDALPEEEIGKSPLSLPSTWIATASDEVLTGLSFKSIAKESRDIRSRYTEVKLGKFGRWKCLGEVGWCKAPIGARETGHVRHAVPLYVLVITDPFSHMLWLEPITGKSSEEVYSGGSCSGASDQR